MNITRMHVRKAMIALGLVLATSSSYAQFSMDFDIPGAQIGINLPSYPQLQPIPGYPVYYAPGVNSNYFFYDGLYWVYDGNNWYASSWYNGPWSMVDPLAVPVFVLRVPVQYYRRPPAFFHGWRASDAPHWGDHWGQSWSSHRTGWDQWNHKSSPAPAPLPTYQRQYTGNRYPQQQSQQASLESHNYRYQPKDAVAQQHFEHTRTQQQAPVARQEQAGREQQGARQQQQHAPEQARQAQPEQSRQPQQAQAQRSEQQRAQETVERNQRNGERNVQNNGQGG